MVLFLAGVKVYVMLEALLPVGGLLVVEKPTNWQFLPFSDVPFTMLTYVSQPQMTYGIGFPVVELLKDGEAEFADVMDTVPPNFPLGDAQVVLPSVCSIG